MQKFYSLKNIALAISIAVVLNVFVGVGINSFYPEPSYEDFCSRERVQPNKVVEINEEFIAETERCNKDYDTARDLYNRNAFLIFVVVGLFAVTAGWLLTSSTAVSVGLIYGGVLAFLVGTIRWWSGMQDILRFLVVGVILIVLILLGTRRKDVSQS